MTRKVNDEKVYQRISDGYFDALNLCDLYSKDFAEYSELRFTKRFLTELSAETKIDKSELVRVAGDKIWIHPQVAINLAQWLSPKLAVLVPVWVFEWMQNKTTPDEKPKDKFADYDPEFGKKIEMALAYKIPKKTSK